MNRLRNNSDLPKLPKFEVGTYAKFPGLNYVHERPFRNWKDQQLTAAIGGWLSTNPPGLELATMAYDELKLRGTDLNAGMKFAAAELEPIPWLEAAKTQVRETFTPDILEQQKEGRLGSNVYVILRHGYSRENGLYGAYVGSTGKSPGQRCSEHRKGIRAARGLPRYGIEPLWSLFDFINPVPKARAGREEWETRLHEALAPVIPKVTGDVAF